MQPNNFLNYYKANILSFFSAIIILGFSIIIGKNNFFLILNIDLGKIGDLIFEFFTYLGDGVLWGIFVILMFFINRKKLPLILLSILLSTIIIHFVKGNVFVSQPRPLEAMPNLLNFIHTIPNIEVHRVGSFPSGHTTQAFAMYLLCCLLFNKKWIVWVGIFIALLVGYSRIYQAQHFPIDITGGIIVAMFTVWVSLKFQTLVEKKYYSQ